jgi:peptidoglycan/LPS O-acetylase OafA/YrhL
VVVYHWAPAVVPGGFVGVTVFFTLSGYLITSLLITEFASTQRISIGRFYERRVRRLLPAATAVIVTCTVWSLLADRALGLQPLAALTWWENWRARSADFVYGLTNAATPLTHFWSLSIEEQFYVVWPLLAAGLVRLRRRVMAIVVSAMAVASFSFGWLVAGQPASTYWHSGARCGEILAGCALAAAGLRARAWLGWLGAAVLLVQFRLLPGVESSLFRGGFALASLATCVLIASFGSLERLTSVPLRLLGLLGRHSYGVYLWHFPAALWFGSTSARIAFTGGATALTYALLERPTRRTLPRVPALAACGTIFAVGVVIVVIGVRAPVVASAETAETGTVTPIPADVVVSRPIRISAGGDSSARELDPALRAYAAAHPEQVTWVDAPDPLGWTSGAGGVDRSGCGVLFRPRVRITPSMPWDDQASHHVAVPERSCDWHRWLGPMLAEMRVEVLVVSFGPTSMWDFEIGGRALAVGTPEVDRRLEAAMVEYESVAREHGAEVLWVAYPEVPGYEEARASGFLDRQGWSRPERADAFARLVGRRSCSADLRVLVRDEPDRTWFSDGLHFGPEGAAYAVSRLVSAAVSCARS